MSRLVAEVFPLGQANFWNCLYCVDDSGEINSSVSDTLLSLIELTFSSERGAKIFTELMNAAEAGTYLSPNEDYADWGYNDINIWFGTNKLHPGAVYITNENTIFTEEDNNGQCFTYPQVKVAIDHWLFFLEQVQQNTQAKLVGVKFEKPYP